MPCGTELHSNRIPTPPSAGAPTSTKALPDPDGVDRLALGPPVALGLARRCRHRLDPRFAHTFAVGFVLRHPSMEVSSMCILYHPAILRMAFPLPNHTRPGVRPLSPQPQGSHGCEYHTRKAPRDHWVVNITPERVPGRTRL